MPPTFAVCRDAETELADILTGDLPTLPPKSLTALTKALRYDTDLPSAWVWDVWHHPSYQMVGAYITRHWPNAEHPDLLAAHALIAAPSVRARPEVAAQLHAQLDRLRTRTHPAEREQSALLRKLAERAGMSPPDERAPDRDARQAVDELLARFLLVPAARTRDTILAAAEDALHHTERIAEKNFRPGVDTWATITETEHLHAEYRPDTAFPPGPVARELTALYFGVGYRRRARAESREPLGMTWWLAQPDRMPHATIVRRWRTSINRMESVLDTDQAAASQTPADCLTV